MSKAEIVKIIAPTAFDYSHDNGVTLLRYEPGQIYEVPGQSIEGLLRRKAIEILDRQAVDDQLAQAETVGGDKPVQLTGEGAEAGDADDGKDDADKGKDGATDKGDDASKGDAAKADASKPSKPSTPAKAK